MAESLSESLPKQSLLKKYDIPIDHLDFGYVKTCTRIKELEKIVKILRSKEEGFYPELLETSEKRLEELDPNNRLLRVEGVALKPHNLEPTYWKHIFDDIEKWSDEFSQKEKDLLSEKNSSVIEDSLPPVRKPVKQMENKEKTVNKNTAGQIKSCDYNKWDKFDAEAECLKMDLEEEKRTQELPIKIDAASELEQVSMDASAAASSLSKSEKEILANKEKELGNEFYKARDYSLAVKSYTKSIAIFPTAFAYNNRAASFLNMECYDMAVADVTTVLQLEPDNVKALYRRAQAFEKLNEFTKALSDLNNILKLEPSNTFAKSMKEKLKNKKSTVKPKSSAGSSTKRSKLSIEGNKENKVAGSSSSWCDGRGEPIPGPSGISTKRVAPPPEVKTEAHQEGAKVPKRKGMQKVQVLEVEREEGATLFDWRRYWIEGKSGKVEVASKFREKASKEPRHIKDEASSARSGAGDCPTPVLVKPFQNGSSIESICSSSPTEPVKPLSLDASNFTHSWELLTREHAPLSEKAQLLKSVRPHLLQAVIGNKLEERMLSDLLCCLRDEFKLKTETPLVIEYLTSFARLERFNIIKTFLPSEIKQVIKDLMEKSGVDVSLKKLYL